MSELVFGKEVELLPLSIDRYGRLAVARVIVEGQDAGLELLKQGLCWVYEKYVAQASAEIQTSYWAAQAAAQSDRLGLWQDPDPVPPWQWRKEKPTTTQSQSVYSLALACCLIITASADLRYPAPGELARVRWLGLQADRGVFWACSTMDPQPTR